MSGDAGTIPVLTDCGCPSLASLNRCGGAPFPTCSSAGRDGCCIVPQASSSLVYRVEFRADPSLLSLLCYSGLSDSLMVPADAGGGHDGQAIRPGLEGQVLEGRGLQLRGLAEALAPLAYLASSRQGQARAVPALPYWDCAAMA